MESTITITHTDQEFTEKVTEYLVYTITAVLEQRNECIIGLSGGSTPKAIYTALGNCSTINWARVYFFLVDDRYIEPTNKDSNQYLLTQTLLQGNLVQPDHIIAPDTTLSIPVCIANYTQQLTDLFSTHAPDIMVLGMGNDGHIASLFPPVAEADFTEKLVAHTQTEDFAVKDRISVSPLVLMAAAKPVLLLKGEDKQQVFEECTAAEMDPIRWPLHIVQATKQLEVFIQA
jgi:6-phosphogluconolactonase